MYEIALFVLFLNFLLSICAGRWTEGTDASAATFLTILLCSFLGLIFLLSPPPLDSNQKIVLLITSFLGTFFSVAAGAIIGVAARNVAKLLAAQTPADVVLLNMKKRERPSEDEDNGSIP